MALPKMRRFGVKTWASLALCAWLAGCGGGQGSAPAPKPEAPPPALQMHVFGPEQVQAGESVLINGSFTANGTLPDSMSWKLLERPAGSQIVLGASAGSSQLLRTDLPGNYVLQWTTTTADGQTQTRQWTVNAVHGPVIQTSTGTSHMQQGEPTTLVAALAQPAEGAAPATYRWTLLNAPAGSAAHLSNEWGQEVRLVADRPGDYQVAVETRQGNTTLRTVRTLSSMTAGDVQAAIIQYCDAMVPNCAISVGSVARLEAYVFNLPDSAPVTFRWSVVSAPSVSALAGATTTGKYYEFEPDVVGLFGVQLEAQLNGKTIAAGLRYFSIVPAVTGLINGPATTKVGKQVKLDSSAILAADGSLATYQLRGWQLAKAPLGSSAKIQAGPWPYNEAYLTPDRPGDYVVNLQVGTVRKYASFTLKAEPTSPGVVYPPKIVGDLGPLLPGEPMRLKVEVAADPEHPLVHTWKMGDGTTLTGDSIVHAYPYPGVYQIQVTATDTTNQRFARQLLSVPVVAERLDNLPPAPCKNSLCGAASAGSYTGQGIGHWRLTNELPQQQVASIDIAGVLPGKQVMISLVNATGTFAGLADLGQAMSDTPSTSSAPTGPALSPMGLQDYRTTLSLARDAMLKDRDQTHAAHLDRDRAQLLSLVAANPRKASMANRRRLLSAAPRAPAELPAINSPRTWNNTGFGGTIDAHLLNTCGMPGGRAVLFWLEDKSLQNALMTSDQVASEFMPVACGEQGGFYRLQKLLDAEVFGPHENSHLIKDDPLQSIHVVLVDGGEYTNWGAYVDSSNHLTKDYYSISNEALVMFVNTRFVKRDLEFVRASLIHEFMHLVNYYQRSFLNRLGPHESWLEETTAMMAEDLLASDLVRKADGTRYAPMSMRVDDLQRTAFSRQYLSGGADYSVGGSLAAYLNRRLGAQLLRGLTFDCNSGTGNQTSLRCLDEQLFKLTGGALSDSYSAMLLGAMAAVNSDESPLLGMPAYVDKEVDLPAIDLKTLNFGPGLRTWGDLKLYAGSHAFLEDTISPSSNGHYRRKGIVVPPWHVLQVLIK